MSGRKWTPVEDNHLIAFRDVKSPESYAKRFGRSPKAVRERLKTLGYHWVKGVEGSFTGRAVADILGVNEATVRRWIEKGWLERKRYPVSQGRHRVRKISWDAILEFIEDETSWHLWQVSRMAPGEFRDWAGKVRDGRGQFFTTEQLAPVIGRSRFWIGDRIARGQIEGRRHGTNYKVPLEEVARLKDLARVMP